ncbi:hypothetical protein HPB50_008448 [Hyalomma asiaticum]|uniref:Uncharacterized protein n=1 Tax=Hyalomma asiaticum TaxID=266040 RepID=A0ACB7TD30_HYAAI|nr:hypothetical protein HPB50_008448 [Hyalomma asiaticum]
MTGTDLAVSKVVVHPLVLLSVVDHFNRMGKIGHQERVVGILLGSWKEKGVLDVSNSFAVPFDEDDKDKTVWFLDHDYLENMYSMFKKVNARERIVGWYHTGPNLHPSDIPINELVRRYCSTSVSICCFVHKIRAHRNCLNLVYKCDGTPTTKTFEHVPSEIGAEEAEEVVIGTLPVNHTIIYQLQDIFNLLPDVGLQEFVKALYIKTNDQMLVVYLASLVRSVVALHNLINNKITNRDAEKKESAKKDEPKEKKPEEKKKEVKA